MIALFLIPQVVTVFCLASTVQNPFLKFTNQEIAARLNEKKQRIIVPAGNNNLEMIPEFPRFTVYRLGLSLNGLALNDQMRTELALKLGAKKIPEIMNALDKEGLLKEAMRLAKLFQIDPLDILGPVIGENTFNGFIDRTIQDSYHKMLQQSDIDKMSKKMSEITNQPDVQNCLNSEISNYWKWRCVLFYSEQTVNNSNRDLGLGFYSFSSPQSGTFGLGQMQPYLIWSLNDIVAEKTKTEKFHITNFEKPMRIIFNNKLMLAYIAANAAVSIEVYKVIAGVDISNNPGLTTTLYNLGDEYRRAYEFNLNKSYVPEALPRVNYMGWYINHFEKQIRGYLKKYN